MKKFLKSLIAIMLVMMVAVSFTACKNEKKKRKDKKGLTPAKVVEEMKDLDYMAELFDEYMIEGFVEGFGVSGVENVVYACSKEHSDSSFVYFAWFDSSESAEIAYNVITVYYEETWGYDFTLNTYIKGSFFVFGKGGVCQDAIDLVS